MKSSKLFGVNGNKKIGSLLAQILLMSLVMGLFQFPALAAGNSCHTSTHPSGVYSVTVCITSPADGSTISGARNVTATVSTVGTNSGVAKLVFYLGGEYILTDFQTPFSFDLPTTKWVDGNRLFEVEALMKDGFTSQRASISLTFNNGIVQPPVNNNSFTPKSGTTPPAGQSFSLVAAGDGAGGMLTAGSVSDLIASWNPNLFLYLGDVYEKGSQSEFYNWYGTSSTFFGRFRSITDPVVGNHEYTSSASATGYFDYWDNIPNYYSFDAAGWHIVALNSNCVRVGGCQVGSPQYQWLAADLAAHPNVCTIAVYHHPIYFLGPADDPQNMNFIWALLAQSGVDIVLNGHDHSYQRWKPLDGNGVISSNGITEFVVGGSGHGLQEFVSSDNRLAQGSATPDSFGALRMQLNQDGAGYQYVNTAGTVLDSGSITCSGAPAADTIAPSKPTNLAATAPDSNTVHLTWTGSTDNVGVTGYDIYRDNSFLLTIPPMTSFDDTTVQPDTTYSYKIRARDAAGKVSAQTSPVTVTTLGLLFSDGFEGGSFANWDTAAGLTIQQQQVYAGLYAVRGTSSGVATYASKQLVQTQNELYYRIWFKILSQNATSQVYLQRFRTATNGAIMGVFVNTNNKLSYRNDVSGLSTVSSTAVTQGVWHELQTHVLVNGASGATEIWLDGTRLTDLSKTENFGNTATGLIQIGETSTGRTYDMALDRVALSTRFINSSEPPEVIQPTKTPTPTNTPTSTPTPTNTPVGAGDRDTTGVFRPSNGLLYLKNSNVSGFADAALNYGLPGDYPVVGDWDGNGTVTIGIYRNGTFYLRNSNTIGFAEIVFPFGSPGDQPIAGDWNGDGIDTVGVYRNGTFYLRNSNDAGAPEISFGLGNPGDVGVAGDWDGNGIDTTGVFRPSNGVIFLKNSNSTGFADIALNYGLPGDQPVMGDWNNDGKDTIGIYRNGTFYLRNSNTNGFAELIFGLGNPGDIPIAGNWDGIPK
jgi:hypothetical protein